VFDFIERNYLTLPQNVGYFKTNRLTMKKNSNVKNDSLLLGKLPPQNIDAEEALLSAILIDNSTIDDVLEILSPEDFYRSRHKVIFRSIVELIENKEPVDLVTLANQLKNSEELENIGGASFLSKLIDEVPAAINARHYAKIISEKASLRALIQHAYAIIKRSLKETEGTENIIDFAESCILSISEKKINPAFYLVRDLLDCGFDTIEKGQANKGMPTGVPSGFRDLDALTSGFQNSDLIILAARPSMGKTALALNLALNAAVDFNIPVGIFSLEMSKEQLVLRLISAESRVNSSRIRDGFITKQDWDSLGTAGSTLYEAPIYIDDSADNTTLAIRTKSRRLKKENGLGMIIIDYLQLMKVIKAADRRDLDIAEISRSLKALAKELEVPVIALSQLNRQLEKRDDKRPRLADLRESGALEQDADLVVFIHREEVYQKMNEACLFEGRAEIIVAKQRNGPVGSAYLSFLKEISRFENYASEELFG